MRVAYLAIAAVLTACSNSGTDTQAAGGSGGTIVDSSVGGSAGTAQGGSGGVAGDGGCDPTAQGASDECKACGEKARSEGCAASTKACTDDAECMAILTCSATCKDITCQAKCIGDHKTGTSKLFPYVGCIDAACHDPCYCSGCRFGTAGCNPCLTTKCATECGGCDKNADCMALAYCLNLRCTDPTDTSCQDGCVGEFDAGLDPYNGLGTCGMNTCKAECGF
ncbi:MAG: hypothetical protein HY898_01950 [Deltaproteobacteria bacterium]|nr:hypothetical protein [Deltaproteobacteria bacterium]